MQVIVEVPVFILYHYQTELWLSGKSAFPDSIFAVHDLSWLSYPSFNFSSPVARESGREA